VEIFAPIFFVFPDSEREENFLSSIQVVTAARVVQMLRPGEKRPPSTRFAPLLKLIYTPALPQD
jgi:hypothetical protein